MRRHHDKSFNIESLDLFKYPKGTPNIQMRSTRDNFLDLFGLCS
jgi:hypothetical protein